MLAPEDRQLLVDAIRPEPGFRLDHGLITTYSLDLDALLSLPLALTFESWSGEAGTAGESRAERADPVALLEALRRHAGGLTVLCQAGAIVKPRSHRLLSFLEPLVHGVVVEGDGVFHPKLWLLRFAALEGSEVRYRLLCLSRNLTYDRSWDTILRLDGELGPGAPGVVAGGRSLRGFVTHLVGLAEKGARGLDDRRREALGRIGSEVDRLRFKPPDGVEALNLWPLGFDGTGAGEVFAGRRDRTLVVSPFLGGGLLKELGLGSEDVLISRQDELADLAETVRQSIGRVAVVDSIAVAEPDSDEEQEAGARDEDGHLSGLHAKVYIADAGWRARLWTGSANATSAAFGSNVEFLVELEGMKRAIGIDRVLGDGLERLLDPYEHDPGYAPDAEQRRLEREIDAVAHGLGALPFRLRAESDDHGWSLALTSDAPVPAPPEGLSVLAWPATLQEHRSAPILHGGELPTWHGLEAIQLTAFLCISISAAGTDLTREVALAVPLLGAPDDREAAVVRSVLEDADGILRYLLFLLGDHDGAELDAIEGLLGGDREATDGGDWLGMGSGATLYEALVRALHRDPARIDRVESLLADLSSETDEELLPEGFERILAAVSATRRELEGR